MRTLPLRRRWLGLVACSGIVIPGVFGGAKLDGAARSHKRTPSITVRPSTRLHDRETVTVTAQRFPHRDTLAIVECNPKVLKNDSAACPISHLKSVTTNKRGTFRTSYTVVTGTVGDGKCGTSRKTSVCYIFVSEETINSKVYADKTIHFALPKK